MCPLDKDGLKKSARRRPDLYEFREGLNLLRILPPDLKYFTEDIDYIAHRYLAHWNLGPEGSPPVTCPRTADTRASCPICEKVRQLRRNPEYKEIVSQLYPRTRFLYNVLDVEHPEKGVQKMETGPFVHDALVKVAVDPDYGDVIDLQVGRNFKITFTPGSKHKTGYNQYDVLAAGALSDIRDKLPENWKETIGTLKDTITESPSEDELRELLEKGFTEAKEASGKPKEIPPKSEGATLPKKEEVPKGEEKPPEKPQEGKLPCFGKEYSPSIQKCKECGTRRGCATEFINS